MADGYLKQTIQNTDFKEAQILIVDDEPANVRLVEKILELEGYSNITSTQDPRRALELCEENDFDLILLDLNMPHVDGFEVLARLQQRENGFIPPVIVLTAQHGHEYQLRALGAGARDYITKPFDRKELLARVHNMIEVQMLHRFMRDEKALLEAMVQERTRELYDTRMQIVRRLGRAAEYRDNETGLHIIRMSKISAVLGSASGMDSLQCDLLLNASPMHDIGKIGIPDEILQKPGKLTEEEWVVMKTHPEIGADILSGDDSELMVMAKEIALTHHEKWNGQGYPHGLAGESIPLVGRIVAVADVFDALTSVRPYKEAWPVDRAIELIRNEAGQHFDPRLVSHFIDNLDEIVRIIERYAEPEDGQ